MIKFDLSKDFFKYYLSHTRLFKKYLIELEETEKYSLEELKEYQNEKIRKIIKIAYENIPFYRETFKKRKLYPQDIHTVDDLQKLPFIDKRTVLKNFKNLKNKNFKGFVAKGYTTGTTGTHGIFLRDLRSINFERAAFWRQYRYAGKEFGSRRVTLRGDLICSPDKEKPPFWRYNLFSKELIMSSFHLSDENMKFYIDEIKKYKPFDLNAYPSAAYILANFCKRYSIDLNFSVVFTSSEMLWDYQREEIEKIFGCKIFDWYGTAERVAAIAEFGCGIYHEMPDYSIVEYIPKQLRQYEVAGTTLHNFVMPLIRYKTGDIVLLSEDKSCSCGRNFRVIKSIYGRDDDFIVSPDGRRIVLLGTIFKGLSFIKEAQIIQRALDYIEVEFVIEDKYSNSYEGSILERLHKYIGTVGIKYFIKKVDHIERNAGSKYKFIKNLMCKDTNSQHWEFWNK